MTTYLQREIVAQTAESLALSHWPYVFGAAGPKAFDCSGLVKTSWATAGVNLPHSSSQQAALTKMAPPTTANRQLLLPGDLVYYYGSTPDKVTHVAVFLRFWSGMVIVAQATDEAHGTEVIRQGKYSDPTGYGFVAR